MTYAITYHSGYDTITQKIQTKATTPPVKRVRKLDESNKGCERNSQRQTAVSSNNDVTNGFLRTSFLPLLGEIKTVQACQQIAKTERDFYQSLSLLAKHYQIKPLHTQSYTYPYNIALALWDIEKQLKNKARHWEEIKLIQDNKETFFTSEERYNTNATLYYIPVVPLYRLLKKRKHNALLLLSVCSYLYHGVNIPYFRQENSFLYEQYEILKELMTNEDDTEEKAIYKSEFEQAESIGDRMEQKIFNPANLTFFKERLNRFKCKDALDFDCLQLAQEAFSLLEQYPNENIFRNARPNEEIDENEEEIENILTMDYYISFYADGKGWLNENIIQCVNTELQEYGQIEEPSIIKRFNGNDITANNLDFENRLFALIGELIYLLNNF